MIRRILVPLDGSRLAEGVLPHVKELSTRLHAEVCFLEVLETHVPSLMVSGGDPTVAVEALEEQMAIARAKANDYLSQLAHAWQGDSIDAKWSLVEGVPAEKIVEFAHANRVDLIAMSTHGRSGLGRLVFGSVADQVLREAGTPVLLIKPGNEVAAGR